MTLTVSRFTSIPEYMALRHTYARRADVSLVFETGHRISLGEARLKHGGKRMDYYPYHDYMFDAPETRKGFETKEALVAFLERAYELSVERQYWAFVEWFDAKNEEVLARRIKPEHRA